MNRFKKIAFAAGILSCMCLSAAAQETPAASPAMPFLNNTLSTRALATGGVSGWITPDAYAQFGNMASASFAEEKFSAGVSYSMWQPDGSMSNNGMLGLSYKINNKFSVTFGAMGSFGKPYEMTDEGGIALGTYTPVSMKIGAGLSWLVTDGLSIGAGLNYAGNMLAEGKDMMNTFAADIQVMYRISDFSISASACNLGLPVSTSGKNFPLPMNGRISGGYGKTFGKHAVAAGVEAVGYFGGPFAIACGAGAEYTFNGFATLRAGYHHGSDKNGLPSFYSAGLGFKLCGFSLDLTYTGGTGANNPMNNTLSAGLGYRF